MKLHVLDEQDVFTVDGLIGMNALDELYRLDKPRLRFPQFVPFLPEQLSSSHSLFETITAADGFYVVAGHNPGVHGAVLTEALSSRFTFQFDVATDYELARSLGIDSRAITAARNLATRQASGETGWSPQLRELLAFAKVSRIFGLEVALANLAGVAPAEDRDVVASTLAKTFGKPVAPLALGRQI